MHMEDGEHDDRMLAPALCTWAAALLVSTSLQWAIALVVGLDVLTVATMIMLRCKRQILYRQHGRHRQQRRQYAQHVLHSSVSSSAQKSGWAWTLVVCACAACCAALSSGLSTQIAARDALTQFMTAHTGSWAYVAVHVRSPAVASAQRGHDCQFEADSLWMKADAMIVSSHVPVMVMGSGKVCHVITSGEYVIHATVSQPRYGNASCWLQSDDMHLQPLVRPRRLEQTVHFVQSAFVRQCMRLDQQARILVPGVTIGVLGQDAIAGSLPLSHTSDVQMGKQLKKWFKQIGIVHLLAVSGGHFLLITDFVRRRCAIWRVPRLITVAAMIISYWGLAAFMFPSDSVIRALCMGVIGACALARGRKGQSISALSWTICCGIIIRPSLARSFGFALSCGAVLGIILFATPLANWCSALPSSWREALSVLSVTLAAQIFTYPIQFLIMPNLTVMSVPANMCVAPVVSFSTICGLVSLMTSWWWPQCGFVFAWCAGRGTWGMAQCARLCASIDPGRALANKQGGSGSTPQSGSVGLAIGVLITEGVFFALVWAIKRMRGRAAHRLLTRSIQVQPIETQPMKTQPIEQKVSMSKDDANLRAWHSQEFRWHR